MILHPDIVIIVSKSILQISRAIDFVPLKLDNLHAIIQSYFIKEMINTERKFIFNAMKIIYFYRNV